jgi:hypothetical protein
VHAHIKKRDSENECSPVLYREKSVGIIYQKEKNEFYCEKERKFILYSQALQVL